MKKLLIAIITIACSTNSFAYYQAEQGRWMSRDPIQEQGGINQYNFVLNNPVLFYDLFGLRTYYIGGGNGASF